VSGGGQIRDRLDLHVRAEAASLAQIRRAALAEFLVRHELEEQRRHDALLVVHELAANAIEHASAPTTTSRSALASQRSRS